jgi:hypothetical protein
VIGIRLIVGCLVLWWIGHGEQVAAQVPEIRYGEVVPRDVRQMYESGVQYLIKSQAEDGSWRGGESGPGVTGMAMMVLLASGEDPNFGLYRQPIRKALRSIISSQDPATGYLGSSMYHHGFAMLALAEAYGVVDERDLWEGANAVGGRGSRVGVGEALELAVRCALTSQRKNPLGAWRYSPDSTDADTSVSGAVLVGLLAARNAGIEVPDEAIDRAISYYQKMTSGGGQVGYSGGLGGMGESRARSSIALLCYQIARRSDLPQAKATAQYLTSQLEATGQDHYAGYTEYYQAQALFQADEEAWEKWNQALVRRLKSTQRPDGSFAGNFGPAASTCLSLLALAVNYRFLPIYER